MSHGYCSNRVCRHLAMVAVLYTLLVAASLAWNLRQHHQAGADVARLTAKAYLDKDQAFRHWITAMGGVYVPVTDQVRPNPYLAQVPDRDLETRGGQRLTLMNSAYVSRQMNEHFPGLMGAVTHVTSLDPLRPGNAPDPWERKALEAFERGVPEVVEVVAVEGQAHLRMMVPFVTEEGCLKCHGHQGYQVGDIRGGTSIALPLARFYAAANEHTGLLVGSHVAFWGAGVAALALFYLGDRRWVRVHAAQEARLRESEERYRGLVAHLPGAVYRCAPDARWSFRYVSDGIQALCGRPARQLMAGDEGGFAALVHPEDLAAMRAGVDQAVARREPYALEYRMVTADGGARWVSDQGQGVFDGDGRLRWLDGVVFDQSARHAAEESLQRLTGLQALILGAAGEGIVSLDREGRVTLANDAACALLGYSRAALIGQPGAGVWSATPAPEPGDGSGEHPIDRTWRQGLPHRAHSGTFRRRDGTTFPVEYVSTPILQDGEVTGAVVVFSDTSERVAVAEQRRRVLLQTIAAVGSLVETRDPFISGHQERVAALGAAMAQRLGFPRERVAGVRVGGQLHDIGKVYVPAEILSRPGRLTDQEMALVQSHVEAGHEILRQVDFDWPVADMVLQHHERMDGSGYPRGLAGDAILPEARILAVADVVEAMTAHRPYRPALPLEAALEEVAAGRGSRYDPEVVDACIALFREDGFRIQ